MSDTTSNIPKHSETLIICCPTCSSAYGDTLGVTGAMDGSLESTVVMRCDECETVYLTPPPIAKSHVDVLTTEQDRVYGPHIRKRKQEVPENTTFLSARISETSILEHKARSATFGRILLPLSLESSADAEALLRHVGSLLDEGGTIDVVIGNADSSCFAAFGGRHWCGYRWPDTSRHYSAKSIGTVASHAGMRVDETKSAASAHAWLNSLRNLLRDWGTNRFVVSVLTGPWLVPWLIASAVEGVALLRGRGAVLIAQLSKA